jgi:hypothetical protein
MQLTLRNRPPAIIIVMLFLPHDICRSTPLAVQIRPAKHDPRSVVDALLVRDGVLDLCGALRRQPCRARERLSALKLWQEVVVRQHAVVVDKREEGR